MSGFVHLHCHSTWSLLDGAIPAEALAYIAAELKYEAIAITDHDALTGAVRFSKSCRDAGVKPIFGAELTVKTRGTGSAGPQEQNGTGSAGPQEQNGTGSAGPQEQNGTGSAGPQEQSKASSYADAEHVTVIAKNKMGYANLCRLISDAHLCNERNRPATTFEDIVSRSEGLFVLSGCARSEVARLAAAGAIPQSIRAARRWKDAIGDDYRIEAFDHRGYGHRTLRDRLLRVAREADVRAVATNDVHYALPEHARSHELLHAIREIVPLSKAHALRCNSEYYLKDANQMRSLFWDVPEVADETLRIADACDFDLDLGSYHFPDMAQVGCQKGETPMELLARKCYEGARRRYGSISRKVDERLQRELRYIFRGGTGSAGPQEQNGTGSAGPQEQNGTGSAGPQEQNGAGSAGPQEQRGAGGYAAYFLLVADIVDHVQRVLGIRCACRGSAAGSLVCYVLGISDVDPIRYDLLFERFMNSRREELPDIDLDVESHRREEVLSHILDAFGPEQTAVCCMVDTFRARMAIRDVGKAMGLPAGEVDLVAKAFPHVRASDIPKALERLPELIGTNLDGRHLQHLFELCMEIDGFPRHLALHPSGVILSSSDLSGRVPMQESFGGFTMLQADKDDVEELGLVKLDVLGVRMQSAVSHAQGEIKRIHGAPVDLEALPFDDEATYRLISSSRTLGCFQIESPGQRELLARLQPHRFEDLIVDISLFRPGPVQSDMVAPYLQRRHGFAETRYPHPSLEPILAETNGVIVFHEQIIRTIAAVTGCSLDDADYIRRHLDKMAVAPQGPDETTNGKPAGPGVGMWFKAAAVRNGFSDQDANALWGEVVAFASFGFCKSHAAAFALPTYISAYLKAHHPAEFLAGVLTHDPGMYPRRAIVADARLLGIPILPIDVNHSDDVYRAERVDRANVGIRLALSQVREISEAEIESIIQARRDAGPYRSLEDLWRRTELSRPVLEHLVHVGALDSIEPLRSRREVLWRALELHDEPKSKPGLQLSFALDEPIQESLPGLSSYSVQEEMEAELNISGIDGRRHVMELYGALLDEIGCTSACELRKCRSKSEVWVAGVKVSTQTPAIRSGQRIIFLTIEDVTGPIEVTVFERAQPRCARPVFHSWLLLIKGEVRKRGGASLIYEMDPGNVGITVVADEAFDLAELARERKLGGSPRAALDRQRQRQSTAAQDTGTEDAARDDEPSPPRLWHASGGSAGR